MNVKELLNKITEKFSKEEQVTEIQKLAKVLEVNKWEINVDNTTFEVGEKVMVTYEDGESYPLSDGEYELEDGSKIQIDSDGVIVLVSGKDSETETKDEVVEEEMKEEEKEDAKKEEMADETTDTPEVTIESLQQQLIDLAQTVAELQSKVDGEEVKEDEMKEEEKEEKEETKEEKLQKENAELLSKIEKLENETPAVDPIINLKKDEKKNLSEYEIWAKNNVK